MSATRTSTTVVVMGLAGSGKTTVARAVARRLGWAYAEGDDFHPLANVEKMRSGRPLGDDDRWPWLIGLAEWIGAREAANASAIVTCSALKRIYRDRLRAGHPSVFFAELALGADLLRERLAHRRGHYMPESLLASQLATLEPLQPDEPGAVVPGDAAPGEVADRVLQALGAAPSV